MSKNKNEKLWQKHLENLDNENSADNFFIQEVKNYNDYNKLNYKKDFFVSPLLEDDLDFESDEGQLAIDVYQNKDSLIVKATMAGVEPADLDISIDNDMLTIRGERQNQQTQDSDDYLYQECYWGKFSRSIVLPVEVEAKKINANMKNGILTIILPKVKKNKSVRISVKNLDDKN